MITIFDLHITNYFTNAKNLPLISFNNIYLRKSQLNMLISRLIKKLSNPKTSVIFATYFISLWLILGGFDSLYFNVSNSEDESVWLQLGDVVINKYHISNSEKEISWLKDTMGHWLSLAGFIMSFGLWVTRKMLKDLAPSNINIEYERKNSSPVVLGGVIIYECLFALINANYVAYKSDLDRWSKLILNPYLPAIIAINFYCLVVLSLFLSARSYLLQLYLSIENYSKLLRFDPYHIDNTFGLRRLGQSIFWAAFTFTFLMLITLAIQLKTESKLSPGNFLSTFLFLGLFWLSVINTIWKVRRELQKVKDKLYSEENDKVIKLTNKLEANRLTEVNREEIYLT